MKDLGELVRRSIRKDFAHANYRRNGRVPKTPHPANTKRIVEVAEQSGYAQYRKCLLGKLVRLKSVAACGVWVEFINEADRKRLNEMAGWSDAKHEYLMDHIKFDD